MAKAKPKTGRPFTVITDEMVDDASMWLGRSQYASRVAQKLKEKYKIGNDKAYEIIETARARVIESFKASGTTSDPLVACSLGLMEIMADEGSSRGERTAAISQMIRLLALDRYLAKLDTVGVEDFLKNVMARKSEAEGGDAATA